MMQWRHVHVVCLVCDVLIHLLCVDDVGVCVCICFKLCTLLCHVVRLLINVIIQLLCLVGVCVCFRLCTLLVMSSRGQTYWQQQIFDAHHCKAQWRPRILVVYLAWCIVCMPFFVMPLFDVPGGPTKYLCMKDIISQVILDSKLSYGANKVTADQAPHHV